MKEEFLKLHSNQRLLVEEMLNRKIAIRIIDFDMELIEAEYNNHRELIMDRNSSIIPYTDSVLIGDKAITKKFLKENEISVPIGMAFYPDEEEFILEAFRLFNKSVVIKPTFGSHGFDVYIDLKTEEEVKGALEKIRKNRGNTKILIEEYFEASEYRVFVTKEGKYAVLYREPAHVVGDSIHNINELAAIETDKRMNPRTNALCPILIDEEVENYLLKKNLNLEYIPQLNEKIYIRANSNVAVGGLCIDYTDKVHPSVIEISQKILKIFPGLPYIGVDFMTTNIQVKQTKNTYKIIEVNSNPGVHMHMNPAIGTPRDVASYMVDLIFPETKEEEL
jgi:D-alanine-D-alanine ligase and related ATP-grasp enzymes